jgi:quercetin dioxygenase-like cupin family protein
MPLVSKGVFAEDAAVLPLLSKELGTDGKKGLMLTVSYAPGAATPIHRHDAHVFVYVLEGAITMQVSGGDPVTLGVGETFYESPTDIHVVSKNASDTETAKFLVFMVKDEGVPPVIPVQ